MALLESSGHFDQDAHVRIAMKYLEEKKVKTLLRDLTQSLLLAQPADPRSYILEELRSETSGPSGSSSSTNACAFLKSSRSSARDAVRELLRRAKDGLAVRAVSFFSAPKGRGRGVLGLGDASQLSGDAFLLVDSSDGRSQGEAGSSVVAECLGSALASESGAAADTCVAWPVRSAQGVEGVLLAELNLPAEVSETLSSLQLYALLLEERLNCIHWEAEARRSAAVVESLLQGVEVLAKPSEEWRESNIQNAAEVPKEVLRGGIELPVASVWEADDRLGSFVKVGGAEGRNSPSTLTTEAFRLSSEDAARVICAEGSWDGSGSKPTSSREICIVLHGIGKPTVLDFSDDPSSKAVEPLRLDHFDIVAAESLCASSLRAALQAQSMLSELTKRKHSAEQMQSLVSELSMTASTTDLVLSIEKAVQAVTQSSRCMVFFIDDDEAWAPPTATVPEPARMVLDVGLPGRIAMLAKERSEPLGALIYNDPATCPYWDDVEFGVDQNASVMVAPIMSAGKDLKPLGLIVASAKTSRSKEGDLLSKLWGPISVDFTQQDADFLEWLASAASSHLDRLSLDVMWTRALLEREGEGAAQDESEDLLVSEYYTEEAMATRSRARTDGSTGRTGSKASGHGRSVGRVNTVHKFTGHVATALDFTSSKGMLALVQEVEKTCIRDLTAEPHVDVSQWEIDYWVLTSHEQFVLLVTAIRQLDIFDHLSIDDGVLMRFFQAVKSTYRSVPFHNFHHAMSTTHYASKMAKVADLSAYLTYPELFALVIGALCHDLDHRGYNNAFEIMTRSELALRYNDSSPLENHHCARAFETALNGVDCNIFEDLGPEVYNLVRKRMVAGILATDMKHHGEHVGILKEFEVGEPSDSQSQFLVEVLMHAADISNPFMPPDKSKRWAVCLNEEFSLQAEKEAELGLPVTSFMSGLHEPQVAAKSLLGFIDFVVTPFTSSVFRLFPDLAELKKFLDQNREAAAIIVEEATSSDRRPAKKSWQSALTRLRGTKDSTGSTNP